MKGTELLDAIEQHNVIIYGTGFVATQFYKIIKEKKGVDCIYSFATTEGSDGCFMGKPVLAARELKKICENYIIGIAVHEAILQEVNDILLKLGITGAIWIYPYLKEMMLGEPIRVKELIPVRKIIKKDIENNYFEIAVRTMVIDEYMGISDIGISVYRKMLGRQAELETVERRLQSFIRLIEDIQKSGYNYQKNISILEDGCIIDGAHRVSCANYFGIKNVIGDIYSSNKTTLDINGDVGVIPYESVIKSDLTELEKEMLYKTQRRLDAISQ